MAEPVRAPVETWQSRVREKMAWAAVLGGTTGATFAIFNRKPVLSYLISTTTSAAVSVAVFGALQEGFKFVRGEDDAWNSAVAGGIAGAALVGAHAGPRYRILGALAWGPLCGLGHMVFSVYPPSKQLELLLIRSNLLDKPVGISESAPVQTTELPPAAPVTNYKELKYPTKHWDDMDSRERNYWIQQIREREVKEIIRRQEEEAERKKKAASHV